MTLVIAYLGKEYQLWCSDGLTVFAGQDCFFPAEHSYIKISRIPGKMILHGWSGDKIYAQKIVKKIHSIEFNTKENLLENFSITCREIDLLSKKQTGDSKGFYSRTGFIVGGYINNSSFLAVVTPSGEVFEQKQYAAIGFSSEIVQNIYHEEPRNLSITSAYEFMCKCFGQAYLDTGFVSKNIFPFVLTPSAIKDFSYLNKQYNDSVELCNNLNRQALLDLEENEFSRGKGIVD